MSGPRVRSRVTAVLGASALCAGLLAFVAVPSANAASGGVEVSIGGAAFTAHPSASLMSVDGLVPGSTRSAVIGVRNNTAGPGSVVFKFVHTSSSENGCMPAELALDPHCDPSGPGQLPGGLTFELARSANRTGPFAHVWVGTARTLESQGAAVDSALAGDGGIDWVRLTVSFPLWAGNEYQSDSFSFGASVTLTAVVARSAPQAAQGILPGGASAGGGGVGGVSANQPGGASGGGGGVGGVSANQPAPHGATSTVVIPPPHHSSRSLVSQIASVVADVALFCLLGMLLVLCATMLRPRWRAARLTAVELPVPEPDVSP